jgi:hypothetical protein
MPDRSSLLLDRRLGRQILESNTAPTSEPLPRLCDAPQELGMMLQSIVQPVVLVLESDKHSSRFAMAGDKNLLGLCEAEESRKIVLDLSQSRLAHWASRAPRASARLRLS